MLHGHIPPIHRIEWTLTSDEVWGAAKFVHLAVLPVSNMEDKPLIPVCGSVGKVRQTTGGTHYHVDILIPAYTVEEVKTNTFDLLPMPPTFPFNHRLPICYAISGKPSASQFIDAWSVVVGDSSHEWLDTPYFRRWADVMSSGGKQLPLCWGQSFTHDLESPASQGPWPLAFYHIPHPRPEMGDKSMIPVEVLIHAPAVTMLNHLVLFFFNPPSMRNTTCRATIHGSDQQHATKHDRGQRTRVKSQTEPEVISNVYVPIPSSTTIRQDHPDTK
jgi:hypothetical protein